VASWQDPGDLAVLCDVRVTVGRRLTSINRLSTWADHADHADHHHRAPYCDADDTWAAFFKRFFTRRGTKADECNRAQTCTVTELRHGHTRLKYCTRTSSSNQIKLYVQGLLGVQGRRTQPTRPRSYRYLP
jgi:hypothetical protein